MKGLKSLTSVMRSATKKLRSGSKILSPLSKIKLVDLNRFNSGCFGGSTGLGI